MRSRCGQRDRRFDLLRPTFAARNIYIRRRFADIDPHRAIERSRVAINDTHFDFMPPGQAFGSFSR